MIHHPHDLARRQDPIDDLWRGSERVGLTRSQVRGRHRNVPHAHARTHRLARTGHRGSRMCAGRYARMSKDRREEGAFGCSHEVPGSGTQSAGRGAAFAHVIKSFLGGLHSFLSLNPRRLARELLIGLASRVEDGLHQGRQPLLLRQGRGRSDGSAWLAGKAPRAFLYSRRSRFSHIHLCVLGWG